MSKFIETRRAQGPRHVGGYVPTWIVRGIYNRRRLDPNAAALVASWQAQGLLPPEPDDELPGGDGDVAEYGAVRRPCGDYLVPMPDDLIDTCEAPE